jgi:hypothetical protein
MVNGVFATAAVMVWHVDVGALYPVKSMKQSVEAYVPVPGVAKLQVDVGAEYAEGGVERLSAGTAANEYG